jgi:hypothetical protein
VAAARERPSTSKHRPLPPPDTAGPYEPPNPWFVEGQIDILGRMAQLTRLGKGWRRWGAWAIVGPLLLGLLVGVVSLILLAA